MQITRPDYYKEFSCIAGECPDTCCAGWQIVIDENSLRKYRHVKGNFRNRLLNDIDWKEQTFRQYGKRCAFLNEDNLCEIYGEAGEHMLCDTCRKYPRHIEEFENLREISLSLSCPEAARILLSKKDKTVFRTVEKKMPEESYEDFDYLLFTALTDTRETLFDTLGNREIPLSLRLFKTLAIARDFQLALDRNELYKWEELRERHLKSGFGKDFRNRVRKHSSSENSLSLMAKMWKTFVPEMEVLRPGWHDFLGERLLPLYSGGEEAYRNSIDAFYDANPDFSVQEERLLIYWLFTYFCGAVYDQEPFAKVKAAVVCTLFIRDLAAGEFIRNNGALPFTDLVSICYRFSRELEHSDKNLNKMDELLIKKEIFSFENLLKVCI